jgi:hypothetical protein
MGLVQTVGTAGVDEGRGTRPLCFPRCDQIPRERLGAMVRRPGGRRKSG